MLRLVGELGRDDLCFCLLSGGGSALLPAPIEGFSLADKATLTRELSARGATIHELNAVRRELSAIKGGGLARACRAGGSCALILSDVPGDDLGDDCVGADGRRPAGAGRSDSRARAVRTCARLPAGQRRDRSCSDARERCRASLRSPPAA